MEPWITEQAELLLRLERLQAPVSRRLHPVIRWGLPLAFSLALTIRDSRV